MAGKQIKISELPHALALDGDEFIEIVQDGVNRKLSIDKLFTPGTDGKSAYDVAVQEGFVGTKAQWLASLKVKGDQGNSAYQVAVSNGFQGTVIQWLESLKGNDGNDGNNAVDGLSAYDLAREGGYQGTVTQWLDSLHGKDGNAGKSAYEIAVVGGYVGSQAQWLTSLKGRDGDDGDPGNDGNNGKSIYELAVAAGFQGTETQYLASLQGRDGNDGDDGNPGLSAYEIAQEGGFAGTEAQWLESLKGNAGEDGSSAYELAVEQGFIGTLQEWLDSLHGKDGNGTGGDGGYDNINTEIDLGERDTLTTNDMDGDLADTFLIGAIGDLIIPPIKNAKPGKKYKLFVKQDISGNRKITFDRLYKFAGGASPVATVAGQSVDYFEFNYSSLGFFFSEVLKSFTISPIAKIGNTLYDTMSAAIVDGEGKVVKILRAGQLTECLFAIAAAGKTTNKYEIAGVINGMRPELHVDGTIRLSYGKAIFNPEYGDIFLRDIRFSGAQVQPDDNGAAIRYNPGVVKLYIERCRFSGNQNGILAAPPAIQNRNPDDYTIELIDCEFDANGIAVSGLTHNIYLNEGHRVHALRSRFTNALYGHDFKNRSDFLLLDRTYHQGATNARELDTPNGGVVHAVNCHFVKDANAAQNNLIGIGQEGVLDRKQEYIFRNCRFENNRSLNYALTWINQQISNIPVKFVDCVFLGGSQCWNVGPFELYYTGGPIGPEGWDQSIRGVIPKRGVDQGAGIAQLPDDQQPQPIYGPDPTLEAFPPTGSTAEPTIYPGEDDIPPVPDTEPPVISIVTSATDVHLASNLTIDATATDNVKVTKVVFLRNGVVFQTKTASPWKAVQSLTTADNGVISYTAVAYDAAGNNTTSAAVQVTVDITPPVEIIGMTMDAAITNSATTAMNAASIGADKKGKRLAVAQAIVDFMKPAHLLTIYRDGVVIVSADFESTMSVINDGNNYNGDDAQVGDVLISLGNVKNGTVLADGDINTGTWTFVLSGGAGAQYSIAGTVGPEGSGADIVLTDSPIKNQVFDTVVTLLVDRSIDGLTA